VPLLRSPHTAEILSGGTFNGAQRGRAFVLFFAERPVFHLEYREIPDVISIPGIFIGMVLMTVFRLDGSDAHVRSFLNSAFGILAGAGSMFLLGFLGELIFRKEALGGGDVKLMGMIGAFLGWKLVLLTFFLAPVFGSGIGIFMKIRFGKEAIAYGPYLSIGALISLLYGNSLLDYIFGF
jgi:leader peptidase (prepilin peptidase)/N-methyltransferase